MFENEGTEIESTQSDVTDDSPSESPSESQPRQQEASAPQKQEEPRIPYERFQEMVAKRQEAESRMQQYEQRMAEMERRFQDSQKQTQPKPVDPMYERLKGIDPEFADYLKEAREQAALAKELQAELQGMRQEQFTSAALNKFDQLNKANSVSPELSRLYKAALQEEYSNGRIKTVDDVEKAYLAVHSSTKKFLEAQERSTIEKYTASKKKDASNPAGQPKGRAPAQGQKVEFSKDPYEAKSQLIKHIAQTMKNGRDQL